MTAASPLTAALQRERRPPESVPHLTPFPRDFDALREMIYDLNIHQALSEGSVVLLDITFYFGILNFIFLNFNLPFKL